MRNQPLARFCACLVLVSPFATAAIIDVPAGRDNTAYSEFGLVSNGAGQHIFTGKTAGSMTRRAFVMFDVAAAIPVGSTVQSAKLKLFVSRTSGGSQAVAIHRLTRDWGEAGSDAEGEEGGGVVGETGDATWSHAFYDSVLWTNQGGDYNPAPTASEAVAGNGFYTWASAQISADVQDMLDNPGSNFGWIIIGNEGPDRTTKRFDSRENPVTSQRPVLIVTFDPPGPDEGACCVRGNPCAVMTPGDCAAAGGTYQGTGTPCAPNDPCVEPTGACCQDEGTCSEVTAVQCAAKSGNYEGDGSPCSPDRCPVVLEPFVDALPIPPVMQPVTGAPGGVAHYEISMLEVQQQLHRDLPPTTVWGYGGSFPAATIETTAGQEISVHWINDLRDQNGNLRTEHYLPVDMCLNGPAQLGPTARTVVHIHGGHLPAMYDGYPENTWLPGESEIYVYPNNQLPTTVWYHDHAMGITRLNVYMGLAGFYLIRDAFELGLGLPAGAFEIPVVMQDRRFHGDGRLSYPGEWEEMYFGDKILVNGKVWPYLEVKRGKYRLRLLNGCNSRTLRVAMSNGMAFHQIGTDGGLLPAPVTLDEILMAPAERADVVVDFASYAPGTEIFLVNSAPAPYPGLPGAGVIPDVMKFVVTADAGKTDPIPTELRPLEVLQESDAVQHREFILRKEPQDCTGSHWLINGLGWQDITEFPSLGSTEVWSFINRSSMMHPMHMHLVMFQVLDRQAFQIVDGEIVPVGDPVPPPPQEAGWKDTVRADPFEITRVIARFDDYTGLYAYHCHILEHEDHEMMRQMRVVLHGDFDDDGDVDLDDFALWEVCQTEPDAGSYGLGCEVFDFDADLDVDFEDFGRFLLAFTGGGL